MAGEGKEKEFKALKDEIRSLHVSVHFYMIFLLMSRCIHVYTIQVYKMYVTYTVRHVQAHTCHMNILGLRRSLEN